MKKRILAFEQIEGRSVDARRMYNAHIKGLLGGKKIGEGLEKCVYDTNDDLSCRNNTIPTLPKNELNVVLSRHAFKEEIENKHKIASLLDPGMFERIFVSLHDNLVCSNLKLPKKCTSQAKKALKVVLTRVEKGSNKKTFATKAEFGIAIINLVFGLWALHAHGLIHADVKISPGAENAVLVKLFNHNIYKLIDLGWVMSFVEIKKGIENTSSYEAKLLWSRRKYSYTSIGHLYAFMNLNHLKESCKHHNVPWDRVVHIFTENIDIAGLMRSLELLVVRNPNLKLKSLLKSLYATPMDFNNKTERMARKIVLACAKKVLKSIDVDRTHVYEMYLPLSEMYKKIRKYCELNELPDTIHGYARMQPQSLAKLSI